LNGTPLPGTAKSGTGSALSMGTFTQTGTYSISGLHTATGCSALMSGQAAATTATTISPPSIRVRWRSAAMAPTTTATG
jgi:pyruvate/2-oxoacid:ferredoxin oxidoreductase beta subunit